MLCLCLPGLKAADKQAIGIDFFKEVRMISNLQTRDGNVYFILKQADMDDNSYHSDLYQWVVDAEPRPLTTSRDVSSYFNSSNGIHLPLPSPQKRHTVDHMHFGGKQILHSPNTCGYESSRYR